MNRYILTALLIIVSFSFLDTFQVDAFDISQCEQQENEDVCRKRLADIEKEIKKLEGNIQEENKNQESLSGEITKLNGEIQKTAGDIQKKSNLISTIKKEINLKEQSLAQLNEKLRREKESLKKILRKRNELDGFTIFEMILSTKKVSAFYEDAADFSYVQRSLSDSFDEINTLKRDIHGEKISLESKRKEEDNERYALTLEKGKIESQKKDRDVALSLSESKEAGLAELKKLREQEIAKIRSALIKFQGSGVTSRSISFGEAYDYAKQAEQKTGVRAAFIMAIMQQETAFGNNVGGCYLTQKPENPIGGVYKANGIYIKSGNPSKKNMIPSHYDAFLRITSSLGLDWKKTPISCALIRSDGSLFGHGGAMGYTQFIPGTWELVNKRVQSYLGVAVANPWNPQHAVMATGVFLQDKGAASQTYTAEYNAACRYYGQCSTYASSVMAKAANIQISINTLEKS